MTEQWYGALLQTGVAIGGFWYIARMFEKALLNERGAWKEMVELQSGILLEVKTALTTQAVEFREAREDTKEHMAREEKQLGELLAAQKWSGIDRRVLP